MARQADAVRNHILERVMSRQLLPGDQIDEAELREALQLSATPIREALIALETAGVIERRPRGGARITALDLEGLVKMIEVLAETEASVAYRAARRINSRQAEALDRAARDCLDFAESGGRNGGSYYDLNLAFHRAVLAAAGNQYLEAAVHQLASRLVGYLAARHRLPGEPLRSARDHLRIRDAILDADADRARALMLGHVSFSDSLALDVMNVMRDGASRPG